MSGPAPAVRRWWGNLRWYVDGMIGADAYDRYVSHLQRHHPDHPVPTKSQFWRQKYDEQAANPATRCC